MDMLREVFRFDDSAVILQLLRWLHLMFGVIWIGHLYFFNFVNGPFEKGLDAALKKSVVPALRPRALWWFRWGAMMTFLTGLGYLVFQAHTPGFMANFFGAQVDRGAGLTSFEPNPGNWWITFGALLGTIMWFNVWFVIWPRQKKILAGIATGNKPADFDQLVSVAGLTSRINTYLSFPMLFGMGARGHFPTGDVLVTVVWMACVLIVGFGFGYVFIHMIAPSVGKEYLAMMPAAPPASSAPTAPK